MANIIEEGLAYIRERNQQRIDETVAWAEDRDIVKAAAAMTEAKVKQEKIKDLLMKYWNLRPSEAEDFIQEAKRKYIK